MSEEHLMGLSMSVCRVLHHIVATMTLDYIVSTMTLDTIIGFDAITAFVIPMVASLTSSAVMWRKEHLWNFSVLQSSFKKCDDATFAAVRQMYCDNE
jgi:hypothetical protein